jgi:hypothetical protein
VSGVRVYIVDGSHVFHSRRDCHYLALAHTPWSSSLWPGGGAYLARLIECGELTMCRRCRELEAKST